MNKYNKELGKRLKKSRFELGLTLKELGKMVNLHGWQLTLLSLHILNYIKY